MRTYHITAHVEPMQRSAGRSSVAASAYRNGEKLYDERTDTWHDYTNRYGVEHSRIYLPENTPPEFRDRQTLWNAVEQRENRVNSCVAKELIVSFPHEFHAMQRREAGDAIAKELMQRYGVAVDIAYHKPDRNGDQRNFHAHLLFTDRGFDASTKDGWAKNKYRDLSNDRIIVEGTKTTKGKEEIKSLRAFSADVMNRIADRDGLSVTTTYLSYKELGINQEPQIHMGAVANDMERNGISTERGNENKKIKARNQERSKVAEINQDSKVSAYDEFSGTRRAEFQQWKWDQELEDDRRTESERRSLAKDLRDWYGDQEDKWKKEIKALKGQIRRSGISGLIREKTGKNETVRNQINALQLNLSQSNMRKREYIESLEHKQQERKQALSEKIASVEQKVEDQIVRERSKYREDDSGEKGEGGRFAIGKTKNNEKRQDQNYSRSKRAPSYSGSAIERKRSEKSIKNTHSNSANSSGAEQRKTRRKKPEFNHQPPRGPSQGR